MVFSPLKSIISHLHQTATMPDEVWFLYTVRWPSQQKRLDEILFYEELRAIAQAEGTRFKLHLFITDASSCDASDGSDSGHKVYARRISQLDLMTAVGPREQRESVVCYICGLPSMTDSFVKFLQEVEGMEKDRVLYEKWW